MKKSIDELSKSGSKSQVKPEIDTSMLSKIDEMNK